MKRAYKAEVNGKTVHFAYTLAGFRAAQKMADSIGKAITLDMVEVSDDCELIA